MENIGIIVLISIAAIIFIEIGHFYREAVQAQLQQELIRVPSTVLDWWSVSHFLLFMLFGLIEPNRHVSFLILGAGFEVFEDMLSSDKTTQLVNCTDPSKKNHWLIGKTFCNSWEDSYWYAKFDDVIMNLIGYTIGSGLATAF